MLLLLFFTSVQALQLKQVQTLLLQRDAFTTSDHGNIMRQITCENDCHRFTEISSAVCQNMGWDGTSVIWKCEWPGVPNDLRIGTFTIQCEGVKGPGDEDIVPGSCNINVHLKDIRQHNSDVEKFILFIFLIILVCIILACIINADGRPSGYHGGSSFFFFGGGGGGGSGGTRWGTQTTYGSSSKSR